VLAVTANGYGKRSPLGEYRLQERGGLGIINIRTAGRNGRVVASMQVAPGDEVLLITANGKLIRSRAAGVSRFGRATLGVRLIQLEEGDVVASAVRVEPEEEMGERPALGGPPEAPPEDPDGGSEGAA
jgi:DNA gyrase subunit A